MNRLSFENKKVLIDGHKIEKVVSINIHKEAQSTAEVVLKFKANVIGLDND